MRSDMILRKRIRLRCSVKSMSNYILQGAVMAVFTFLCISNLNAQMIADFEGGIKLGDIPSNAEQGQVRWTGGDYEGYDGERWRSFTKVGQIGGETVTDIDGHVYRIVRIGDQTWMRENLRTSHYADGSDIQEITFTDDWLADTLGARCWYWNDPGYDQPFGKLYNFYAATNDKGLCPTGWKVPSLGDWRILYSFLGNAPGNQVKQPGDDCWSSTIDEVNNESGFTAIPTGRRQAAGSFVPLGFEDNFAIYWSSTEETDGTLTIIVFSAINGEDWDFMELTGKYFGLSIRCIKE